MPPKASHESKLLVDCIREHLRAQRILSNVTLADMAKAMHTTKSSVSAIEKGSNNPSVATLVRYAYYLGFELTFDLVEIT